MLTKRNKCQRVWVDYTRYFRCRCCQFKFRKATFMLALFFSTNLINCCQFPDYCGNTWLREMNNVLLLNSISYQFLLTLYPNRRIRRYSIEFVFVDYWRRANHHFSRKLAFRGNGSVRLILQIPQYQRSNNCQQESCLRGRRFCDLLLRTRKVM